MKKKEHINEQDQNKMEEPGLNYQVNSKFPSTGKKFEKKGKIFEKKAPPKDFPDNCVTMDTFFSDLEDFIYQNEKV
jgi:hypothetical protein